MARRKLEDRSTRTLIKGTTSYMITLPVEHVRALKWRGGQKVVANLDEKKGAIIIRDWKPKRK